MMEKLAVLLASSALQSAFVAFTIPQRDLIPEGIAYDPDSRCFFVGSTYRRKVVRVDAAGQASDFVEEQAEGLWGVVGIKVDIERRLLWVASSHAGSGMPMVDLPADDEGRAGLFAFDLEDGDLVHRALLERGHFLNDVVVTPSGDVLVTDSRSRVVYRYSLETGTLDPFVQLDELGSPNGIAASADGNTIFVAVGEEVAAVNLAQSTPRLLARPNEHKDTIDGLYVFQGSLIAIQPWAEEAPVVRLTLGPSLETIESVEPIVKAHTALSQPTTAAIVGNDLYLVANSQLQMFRRAWNDSSGSLEDTSFLAEPIILRIPLTFD